MDRRGYVIEGLNRLTGRWEQITPILSRGVADETMTAYGGKVLYKSAYRKLRLQRVDGIQLALDFGGGDGGTKKKTDMIQDRTGQPQERGGNEIAVYTMTRRTMTDDGVELVDVATVVTDGRHHHVYTRCGRRQYGSVVAALMSLRLDGYDLDADGMLITNNL